MQFKKNIYGMLDQTATQKPFNTNRGNKLSGDVYNTFGQITTL